MGLHSCKRGRERVGSGREREEPRGREGPSSAMAEGCSHRRSYCRGHRSEEGRERGFGRVHLDRELMEPEDSAAGLDKA